MTTCIVVLRQELRTHDNPALFHAYGKFKTVVPVYIYDENHGKEWKIGSASKWWLHNSLLSLSKDLPLIILKGDYNSELKKIIKQVGARAVYWNRCYEPFNIKNDTALKAELKEQGLEVESFNSSLLFEPWEVKNQSGTYFKVFTHFWKKCNEIGIERTPLPKPKVTAHDFGKIGVALESLELLPTKPDWAEGFRKTWEVGEEGAWKKFKKFLERPIQNYYEGRNLPAESYTSMLSPHLHFGEISPLQIWYEVKALSNQDKNTNHYLSEIGWREFSYNLLFNFPELPNENFRPEFNAFEWQNDETALRKWQKGMTGYPIVDAGMRELWATGYMHNRVRMIVGSFLTKDLLIDWREGAKWFWDTLCDADLASNSASWQWVAGSGADAAPYYRIFNPILQGEKFDPLGKYVRKWVPELENLPDAFIHKPWEATPMILRAAGVSLGGNYPSRIVEHDFARNLALKLFKNLKGS